MNFPMSDYLTAHVRELDGHIKDKMLALSIETLMAIYNKNLTNLVHSKSEKSATAEATNYCCGKRLQNPPIMDNCRPGCSSWLARKWVRT